MVTLCLGAKEPCSCHAQMFLSAKYLKNVCRSSVGTRLRGWLLAGLEHEVYESSFGYGCR